MRPETVGIIVGGIIPAILFGVINVIAKAGAQEGVSAGNYILLAGLGIAIGGFLLTFLQPETVPMTSATMRYAVLFGFFWSLASGLIMYSLIRYKVPMSKLVPLFSMSSLIAVTLLLVIFAEWKTVNLLKLLFGAFFVVIGGVLVSLS